MFFVFVLSLKFFSPIGLPLVPCRVLALVILDPAADVHVIRPAVKETCQKQ